jgi:hypothetical protein
MTVISIGESKSKPKDIFDRARTLTKEKAAELGVAIHSNPGDKFGRLVETKPGGLDALRKHRELMDAEERKHKVVSIKEHEHPYWNNKK